MAKVTLQDITSWFNKTTRINANNDTIEQAFENTLSRDGTVPNSMNASLDMNFNEIINLGAPTAGQSAARWVDVTDFVNDYFDRTSLEVAAGVTPSNYSYPPGNVKRYGAVGDDATDDTTAFQNALATDHLVFVPYGTYRITSSLVLNNNGMVGEGWGTSGLAKSIILKFYNMSSATTGAIRTSWAAYTNGYPKFEGLYVVASSWDEVTGCQGYGLDITAPILCRNVAVVGFREYNLFLHNTATDGQAPYQALFENFYSAYAGKHGIVVGTGANTVTFINTQSKWNGAPSFGTAPGVAGIYDGFHVSRDGDGNPSSAFFSYVPQSLVIIGGNCSYNSRYGWNFNQLAGSNLMPGYAEGNLQSAPGQARIGVDIQYCHINFGAVAGDAGGVDFAATFAAYAPTNTIIVGGQHCGSGNDNTETSRYNFWNSNKITFMAHSSDLSNQTYIIPDNSTGAVTLGTIGTGQWNFGRPIYRNGTQIVNTRRTGWSAPAGTATRTAFDTGTVTTAQLAERVKALIDDLIAHGLIGT